MSSTNGWALLAALAFILAAIFNLVGGGVEAYWITCALAGGVFVALQLAFGGWGSWGRRSRNNTVA